MQCIELLEEGFIKKSNPATFSDFEWLFGIAKAHGMSFANIKEIALVELRKPLNDFNHDEVIAFGHRLCPYPVTNHGEMP